jgi:Fur family ferric uptake transcriptional regulator
MQEAGHLYTRGRQLVMDTLAEIAAPATAPAILQAAPRLVQSSLYRNLAVLQDAGLVTRVDVGEDRAFFELSELVTQEHHHHLVCRECSTVVDVALPARAERALGRALGDAAHDAGFELTDHRVDLVGVCATCRAA